MSQKKLLKNTPDNPQCIADAQPELLPIVAFYRHVTCPELSLPDLGTIEGHSKKCAVLSHNTMSKVVKEQLAW